MKVVLSRQAVGDLEEIASWIMADSPNAARRVIRDLRQRCASLATSPTAFPLLPRYERLGVRRRVHGNYLILYRIEDHQITIVHIVYGARDLDRLLSNGD